MKKLIIAALLLLGLTACVPPVMAAEQETLWVDPAGCSTTVVTDKTTNVQYIIVKYKKGGYGGGVSITPRLAADGSPYVYG